MSRSGIGAPSDQVRRASHHDRETPTRHRRSNRSGETGNPPLAVNISNYRDVGQDSPTFATIAPIVAMPSRTLGPFGGDQGDDPGRPSQAWLLFAGSPMFKPTSLVAVSRILGAAS